MVTRAQLKQQLVFFAKAIQQLATVENSKPGPGYGAVPPAGLAQHFDISQAKINAACTVMRRPHGVSACVSDRMTIGGSHDTKRRVMHA